MFRLIRKGKMEWRAELPEQLLQQVRIGQKVSLHLSKAEKIHGAVARISPVIDMQTRNGTVYVELPPAKSIRAGMFAQGELELGNRMRLPFRRVRWLSAMDFRMCSRW